ncbi:protein artichoke-like isoform X2 [Aedes albopictus]|uniref:Leucine-rich repeat protein n=1 Tax=Aedes albopictus TaxID=7160 RepID=A0ABM1ZDC3_AEDAL
MKGILILLLFIASLDGMKSFSVQPSEYQQNGVVVSNFHWPADAASVGKIPDVETLHFINIEVDILSRNFTDRFQRCTSIRFDGGKINTFHISPKLSHIELESTDTENVIIESAKYYQLEKFECRDAHLTRIPESMSQLKKMKYLNLNHNSIQTVQLDQLNGLDNLEILNLLFNKINHIHNHGSVNLPSLTELHLGYNQLKHIDVCSWNMPKLSYLNVVNNRLTHFTINNLRGLKQVNLARNPLNCVWKDSLLRSRTDIKIERELTCDTDSTGIFGLDCPSSIDQLRLQNSTLAKANSQTADHVKQQISNFDTRLARIEETVLKNYQQFSELSNRVQKNEAEMNKRLQKMEQLLIHFSKKVVEQQNVSNDIIEAIYRAEIERIHNSKKKP